MGKSASKILLANCVDGVIVCGNVALSSHLAENPRKFIMKPMRQHYVIYGCHCNIESGHSVHSRATFHDRALKLHSDLHLCNVH